jgi:hypothetical protein
VKIIIIHLPVAFVVLMNDFGKIRRHANSVCVSLALNVVDNVLLPLLGLFYMISKLAIADFS